MITLQNLTIGFGQRVLLDNVSTCFQTGQLTSLIGCNGSGKSTLLKAIGGLNNKYSGEILIAGENIKNIPPRKLAETIAFVNTQRPRMANLKCKDVVALGRSPYTNWHGKLSDKDREIINSAVGLVGMEGYMNREFNSLSDGESQKIMIARAIAQDTKVILLDEPTSFLDLPTRYELVSLLKRLTAEQGKTIIYSTHELDISMKFSDSIALIDDRQLVNLPVEGMKEYIKQKRHPFSECLP